MSLTSPYNLGSLLIIHQQLVHLLNRKLQNIKRNKGVEVTEKKVRRERMGHIRLVVPIAHIWYLRSLPSKMAALLGIPTKKLETVIYYEKYIIIQAGELEGKELEDETIENGMLLDEDQYQTA